MPNFMKVKIWGDESRKHPDFKEEGSIEKVAPPLLEYLTTRHGLDVTKKPRLSDYKAVLEVKPGKSLLDAKVRLDIESIKEK